LCAYRLGADLEQRNGFHELVIVDAIVVVTVHLFEHAARLVAGDLAE
jgi:hypothetical protein